MKYTHNITRCSLLGAVALCGALLSATGCSKDPETVTEGQILAFSVSGDNFELAPQTKAVKFTSESTGNITSIYVAGWNGDTRIIPAATETDSYAELTVEAEGTGTVKYLAKTEVAWAAPYERTFYAYANVPSTGVEFACTGAGQQTLTYTVPADAAAQCDILMASYVGDGTRSGKERIAPLAFKHPLTAVSFVRGSSFADITAVKYIELDGVYAGGTLTHTANKTTGGSFSWSGTGTQTVSQTVSGLPASAGDAIGEPFIFIPQSGTNHTMKMTVTIGGKDVDLTGTISAPTWEAGSSYTYRIDYAGAGTGFYITITDWDVNENATPLKPGEAPDTQTNE